MDFLPKPVKLLVYAAVFILVLMGGAKAMGWFVLVGLGVIFYAVMRLVTMDCHHRYTGLPVALMVLIAGLLSIRTPQTLGILALVMLFDVFT